jgi:hypothetical protein
VKRSIREYRRARRGVAGFLAIYFIVGLGTLCLPAREIFPFYNWFLFALVPQGTTTHYELILHEVNGRAINPPRRYQEADGLVRSPHNVTVYRLTQKIGETNDPQARELLEKDWLPPKTRYEIVKPQPSRR